MVDQNGVRFVKKNFFIEKKTGVDEATQVLDNELFDFDREV